MTVSVSLGTITPIVLVVHPSLPVKTVKDLVAIAKAKPTQLNYASTGNGGSASAASCAWRCERPIT
mgnify:CR=1 FL=1